jgi:nitrite reductase (NO-forming)
MNKRYSILSITAVAVIAATLFGSTYTQSQLTGNSLSVSTTDADLMQKIHDMGGLQLVMPQAFAELDCANLESGRNVVEFNVVGQSAELPIMGGKTYMAMTFSGQVPGPTLRVTQGDIVKMTLTVEADEPTPHGNDMHASQMSAGNFGAVQPGTSKTYCYIAQVPGTFKYHCSGVNVAAMDQHVLSGMYGMTIVDPLDGYKKLMVEKTAVEGDQVVKDRTMYSPDALEFTVQYNQLYLTEDGNYDMSAMMVHHQTQTVVNGMAFGYVPNEDHNALIKGDKGKNIFVVQPWNSADLKQYQSQLIFVPTGVHTRFFVENQGNEPVFFHIVGEIIDKVTQGNRVQAQGTETWLVGGSQGAIMDVVFDEPGVYVIVNHDYAAIFSGAATVIVAGNPFGLEVGDAKSYAEVLGNPSDAVPPAGMNSMSHPKLNLHGLYTDARADEIKAQLGI